MSNQIITTHNWLTTTSQKQNSQAGDLRNQSRLELCEGLENKRLTSDVN